MFVRRRVPNLQMDQSAGRADVSPAGPAQPWDGASQGLSRLQICPSPHRGGPPGTSSHFWGHSERGGGYSAPQDLSRLQICSSPHRGGPPGILDHTFGEIVETLGGAGRGGLKQEQHHWMALIYAKRLLTCLMSTHGWDGCGHDSWVWVFPSSTWISCWTKNSRK